MVRLHVKRARPRRDSWKKVRCASKCNEQEASRRNQHLAKGLQEALLKSQDGNEEAIRPDESRQKAGRQYSQH